MKAYVIAAETVKDQAMFDDYRQAVPETLGPFGGHFAARGGNLTVLEGEWPHSRLVIIEFPSRADAEGWYRSPAYQKVISPEAQEFRRQSGHRRRSTLKPARRLQERTSLLAHC